MPLGADGMFSFVLQCLYSSLPGLQTAVPTVRCSSIGRKAQVAYCPVYKLQCPRCRLEQCRQCSALASDEEIR